MRLRFCAAALFCCVTAVAQSPNLDGTAKLLGEGKYPEALAELAKAVQAVPPPAPNAKDEATQLRNALTALASDNLVAARASCMGAVAAWPGSKWPVACLNNIQATEKSTERIFLDRLRQPWLYDLSIVVSLVASLWFVLWISRKIYWALVTQGGNEKVKWTLLPITELAAATGAQTFGATEAVMDALRRMPREVGIDLWSPRRLVLRPLPAQPADPEIWEDFLIGNETGITKLQERIRSIELSTAKNERDKLAEAFQSLQFTAGAVNLGFIGKFVRALSDWWQVAAPSFGGTAMQNRTADGKEEIIVRLTCANGPYGTISVIASTPRQFGVDALGLSAERAAYKLLYRVTKSDALAAEVDAHASFRQGVALLRNNRTPAPVEPDRKARLDALGAAAANLRAARLGLDEKDEYNRHAIRLEGVTQALTGNHHAAIERFSVLATSQDGFPELQREAIYNQAMVHYRLATSDLTPVAPAAVPNAAALTSAANNLTTAARLFQKATGRSSRLDESTPPPAQGAVGSGDSLFLLSDAALTATLALLPRSEWRNLDVEEGSLWINSAIDFVTGTVYADDSLSSLNKLRLEQLITESHKAFGPAYMRYAYAFFTQDRKLFRSDPPGRIEMTAKSPFALAAEDLDRHRFHIAETEYLASRSFAFLLAGEYESAEKHALDLLKITPESQFAIYVAAESRLCRKNIAGAKELVDAVKTAPSEPLLAELKSDIEALPSAQPAKPPIEPHG